MGCSGAGHGLRGSTRVQTAGVPSRGPPSNGPGRSSGFGLGVVAFPGRSSACEDSPQWPVTTRHHPFTAARPQRNASDRRGRASPASGGSPLSLFTPRRWPTIAGAPERHHCRAPGRIGQGPTRQLPPGSLMMPVVPASGDHRNAGSPRGTRPDRVQSSGKCRTSRCAVAASRRPRPARGVARTSRPRRRRRA